MASDVGATGPQRGTKEVFVIMPFEKTSARNELQLTSFFTDNIKRPIEAAITLKHRYSVRRSGQKFDISTEIIRDLCRADVVIADLSGEEPNPNVMYELGVRLAISHLPVILIREKRTANRRIFDIYGFYTHDYDPFEYRALEEHLVEKLRSFESEEETYSSPVLKIINEELARSKPDLTSVPPERQRELALRGLRIAAENIERAYGPHGLGLSVVRGDEGNLLYTRGADIAAAMTSANPFEEAGIRAINTCADSMRPVGDGSKLAVILTRALIDGCWSARSAGLNFRHLQPHLALALDVAREHLRKLSKPVAGRHVTAIADTAAARRLDVDVSRALELAGPDGIVAIDRGTIGRPSSVEETGHPVFDRGAIHPTLAGAELRDCLVLAYAGPITSLTDAIPVLEIAAQTKRPLLLVVSDLGSDALQLLLHNIDRQVIAGSAIKIPGIPGTLDVLEDLAVLTGATVIDPARAHRLADIRATHLGSAERVVVGGERTDVIGGRGSPEAIAAHVNTLKGAAVGADRARQWVLRERIARLSAGIVSISVGGDSSNDMRDALYRTRSAVNACYVAIRTGWITGGGVALRSAGAVLGGMESGDEAHRVAINVVKEALETPFMKLIPREQDAQEITAHVTREGGTFGYNVVTRRVEDLMLVGVLDPLGVVTHALSVAYAESRSFFETGAWHVNETSA